MLVAILLRCVGLIFMVSAILKGLDLTAFAVQLSYYGIVRDPTLVKVLALSIVVLEVMLGLALILRIALRKCTLPATIGLLLAFTVLLAWTAVTKDIENCGCFGKYIQMSPLQSILKNLILISITGFVWWCKHKTAWAMESDHSYVRTRYSILFVGTLGILTLALISPAADKEVSTLPLSSLGVDSTMEKTRTSQSPFAKYNITWQDKIRHLSKGTYLIALLSDSCTHCADEMPGLKRFADHLQAPTVVALMLGEEDSMADFNHQHQPNFPMQLIPPLEFFNLLGDADAPPRFVLIQNGEIIQYWNAHLPKAEKILQALGAS